MKYIGQKICWAFSLVVVLIGISNRIAAQQCYIPLSDASAVLSTQDQLDSLEHAACRLLDSLPGSYADSFKVVSFGFYLHNETTNGGYPEVFQKVIDEVGANHASKYYLIFGKQTDKDGIYTKFWVALNLPNQDIFYCIDQLSPTLRSDLTAKYGIIANAVHDANEKAYLRYHEAEIAAIDSLRGYVTALKDCCIPPGQQRRGPSCTSCAFTPSEFGQNLVNKGFSATGNQLKLGEITSVGISADVIGRTNLILEVEGDSIEVDKQVSGIAERYALNNPGKTIKIYLNRYDDLCGSFDATYTQFVNNGSNAKVFIVAIQYPTNQVKLYFYYDGELGIDEANAIEFVKGFPDHYFDLAGNYLGKDEGNWSRIRVINKPLSDVLGLYKNQPKKIINKAVGEVNSVNLGLHIFKTYEGGGNPDAMFSSIGQYYTTQFGCYKPIVLRTKVNLKALAWVEPGEGYTNIYVNKESNDTLKWLNNYNHFMNALYHENMHIITQKGSEDFPCDHAKFIYIEQFKHSSFLKCSYSFRVGMLSNFGCYLAKCYDVIPEGGGGNANVVSMINETNVVIKKLGLQLFLRQDNTGSYVDVKNTKTGQVHTQNCISNEGF